MAATKLNTPDKHVIDNERYGNVETGKRAKVVRASKHSKLFP